MPVPDRRDDPNLEPQTRPMVPEPEARPAIESPGIALLHEEPVPSLEPGTVVHRYVVEGEIGSGAMGTVYAARDGDLDRRVALKLLRDPRRGGSQGQRLLREAKALARLSHPNVVAVYDAGTHGNELFLAMELVDGQTLRSWLAEPRTWREVLDVFREAGAGLAAAHAAGIIHRDFKPDNVLIDRSGRVRVGDFGVAQLAAIEREEGLRSSSSDATLTMTGTAVGTPAYMAPEQQDGSGAIDARADQFGFCVALYEGLYGRRPFAGDTVTEVADRIVRGEIVPPPRDRGEPVWLRRAIMRGLARAPGDRHPTMDALLRALSRDRGGRRRWAVAGAAALAAALAGGIALCGRSPEEPCRGGAARLAGVWNPGARRAIDAAFRASGSPLAASALDRVDRVLDRRAREWVTLRDASCAATHVRREQPEEALDLVMHCLDRRLGEMRALAGALASADSAAVTRAGKAVEALPPIESCADVAALSAEVPPPDPHLLGAVEALRERHAELRALHLTGRYREALEPARALAADARALAYRSFEAEALLLLGKLQYEMDELAGAEASYTDAIAAAKAGRSPSVEMESWLELLWLVGLDQARYGEARRLAQVARGTLVRVSKPERFEASLDDWEGALLVEESIDIESARPLLERALAVRKRLFGPDSLEVVSSVRHLADLALSLRKHEEALQLYRQARAVAERALGVEHPDAYGTLAAEGIALDELGRDEEAVASYRRGLELAIRVIGPESFEAAIYMADLGLMLADDKQYTEARRLQEQALAIIERIYGPDHTNTARACINLSGPLRDLGEHKQALALLERAAAIFERSGAPDLTNRAVAILGQGEVSLTMGDADKAHELAERGLALHRAANTPEVEHAWGWFLLAKTLRLRGDEGKARPLAERARTAFEEMRDPKMIDEVDTWLARRARRQN
jgi:eukaryotic-like serine/threonine-protein kinase